MDHTDLQSILNAHSAWLNNPTTGGRADLRHADLTGANLTGASLSGADLYRANLRDANLYCADLRYADLRYADLTGANLYRADLRHADLGHANLTGANLYRANLYCADLPNFQIPQEGELVVWKKAADGCLVKLLIPADAKRTACLINGKCRAESAHVLRIIDRKGDYIASAQGLYHSDFTYRVDETVSPDSYDPDIRVDCTHGIHFFLTIEEAEKWG